MRETHGMRNIESRGNNERLTRILCLQVGDLMRFKEISHWMAQRAKILDTMFLFLHEVCHLQMNQNVKLAAD